MEIDRESVAYSLPVVTDGVGGRVINALPEKSAD